MKRTLCFLISLILIFSVSLCIFRINSILPYNTHPLIEEKYAGWNGVLRIWICEGWKNGSNSFSGWLNECIRTFEKSHSGVYAELNYVTPESISSFSSSGIRPPDMLIYSPGILHNSDILLPLENKVSPESKLHPSLSISHFPHSLPIAMGGYLWIINENPSENPTLGFPSDDSGHFYSAAAAGLCTATERETSETEKPSLPGIDLGLPAMSDMPASFNKNTLHLPADYIQSSEALNLFTQGKIDAIIGSQHEIARLERLSDLGKAPDWSVCVTGNCVFTDQLLFLSVVQNSDEEAPERQSLSIEFANTLLSDECQSQLSKRGAISVTGVPGKQASAAMRMLEQHLNSVELIVPNAIGKEWIPSLQEIVRKFLLHTYTGEECIREISSLFPQRIPSEL